MMNYPIIDSHVHLWNPARQRMRWLDGNTAIERPFTLDDFGAAAAGLPVEGIVYVEVAVEPAYAFLEAQAVATLAQQEPRIQGIVAAAPVEDGPLIRDYLAALVALGPQIKGVRRLLQGESDPAFCLRPGFVAGVRLLPEFGLSFDLCIYHHQLPAVIDLVAACPETAFVLDHLGKPDIKNGTLDPWREQLAALAALPNVDCKVSGIVTEADHGSWQQEQLAPYVAHALAVFGEDRVLFGGDWPVALLASPYERWVATLDDLTSHLSDEARQKLWQRNARRVYRLPTPSGAQEGA